MKKAFISFLVVLIVILILAGIGSYLFSLEEEQAGTETIPIVVNTKKVHQQDSYPLRIDYTGQVEARRKSEIGFELAGKVTEISVDEGDQVEAGTLLANLDTEILESQKNELQSQRERAEADLEMARLTFARREESWEGGAVPRQSYDEARQNYLAKQAQVESINAQIESVNVRLNKSSIVAPYQGVISHRLVDEGTVVQAGQPVLTLIEEGAMEVRIGVQNEIIPKLKDEQLYHLQINDATYPARLKTILPVENRNTRTVDVKFELEENNSIIRDGDLAVWVYEQKIKEKGFWLPMAALTESSRGLWACYIVVQDATQPIVKRRELEILHQSEDLMYVTGTLQKNDLVVVNGIHRLVPNMPVQLHQNVEE